MTVKIRVVKVGGSLLTWKDLVARLEHWLSVQPTATTILLAGGGPWAELLRHAAKRFTLDERSAHCMCVQAMSITATLLAEVTGCRCARSLAELWMSSGPDPRIVLDVQDWLLQDASTQDLPKTWAVTSDSIAARLAVELSAEELVLLKSRAAPAIDFPSLVDAEYVDAYFPTVAANIPKIRYVSLR